MGIAPYKYFTFDGESSRNYDVYLTGTGVFNAPQRAVDLLEIPGRNGNYALDQGRFNNITVTYKAGIVDYSESDFADKVSAVRNWLCSKVGYVRLTDDYNPDEYRMAVFKNGITVDHDDLKTGEFDITFECKPQRWLTSGETPIEIGAWGDTQTVSGDIVQFNALETDKVKSLVADIDPIQDLYGYDKPWVGGSHYNQWDEEWELGSIDANGQNEVANDRIRSKNYIKVTPNTSYYVCAPYGVWFWGYDSDHNYVQRVPDSNSINNTAFTVPSGISYLRFVCRSNYGTTYHNDIAVNYPSTVTTYSPYSNICPISGWSGVDVYDDPKHGGIIEWNQLAGNTIRTISPDGLTITPNNDGSFTVNGTATKSDWYWVTPYPVTGLKTVGHKYYVCNSLNTGVADSYGLGIGAAGVGISSGEIVAYGNIGRIFEATLADGGVSFVYKNGVQINNVTFKPMFIDLTEMFGAGNEPSTVDEFKSLFPKDYYAYNAGTETCVSAVNGDPYEHYTTSLGTTVYGGSVDIVSGSGSETYTNSIDLYDLSWSYNSTYNYFYSANLTDEGAFSGNLTDKPCICDRYPCGGVNSSSSAMGTAADFTLWARCDSGVATKRFQKIYIKDSRYTDATSFKNSLSGSQLIYKKNVPTTISVTAQQIDLLLGTNNIWADTGDVTVEYGQDPMVLSNPTPFEAEPLLAIKGYGTIDFNGYEVEIENGDLGTIQLASETDITETSVITLNNVAALLNVGDDIYFVVDPSRPGGYAYSAWLKKGDYYSSGVLTSSSNVASTPTISFPSHNPDIGTMSLKPDTSAGFKYGTSSTITATAVFDCTLTDSSTLTLSVSMSYAYDGSDKITVTRTLTASGTYSHISYMKLFCESDSIPEVYGDSTKTLLGNPTYIDCDLGECYKYEGGEIVSLNEKITLGSDLPKLSSGANTFTMDGTVTELKVTPRYWKV